MAAPKPALATTSVPLDTLEKWPGNARRGIVAGIKESIRVNGVFQPLIVQKSTNRIIAGNHRYDALVKLHEEEPDKWGDRADVIILDVNDNRALKMNVADNKTSDDASWDTEALVAQLRAVLDDDGSLLGTGFAEDELDDLVSLIEADDLDALADEFGEPNDDDLWPTVSIKMPPDLRDRFIDALESYDGDTHAQQVGQLLDAHPNHRK